MPQRHRSHLKHYIQHAQLQHAQQTGAKVPQGSQLVDGSDPNADGPVKLSIGKSIPAHRVTLPDSTTLAQVTKPSAVVPKPAVKMPVGSRFSESGS